MLVNNRLTRRCLHILERNALHMMSLLPIASWSNRRSDCNTSMWTKFGEWQLACRLKASRSQRHDSVSTGRFSFTLLCHHLSSILGFHLIERRGTPRNQWLLDRDNTGLLASGSHTSILQSRRGRCMHTFWRSQVVSLVVIQLVVATQSAGLGNLLWSLQVAGLRDVGNWVLAILSSDWAVKMVMRLQSGYTAVSVVFACPHQVRVRVWMQSHARISVWRSSPKSALAAFFLPHWGVVCWDVNVLGKARKSETLVTLSCHQLAFNVAFTLWLASGDTLNLVHTHSRVTAVAQIFKRLGLWRIVSDFRDASVFKQILDVCAVRWMLWEALRVDSLVKGRLINIAWE